MVSVFSKAEEFTHIVRVTHAFVACAEMAWYCTVATRLLHK